MAGGENEIQKFEHDLLKAEVPLGFHKVEFEVLKSFVTATGCLILILNALVLRLKVE